MKLLRQVCLWVLVCGFVPVRAQRILPQDNPIFNGERKFAAGICLGANFTQVDGDYMNGYHKVGLNTGFTGWVSLSRKWGLALDLLFSQKGSNSATARESSAVGTYFEHYRIRLNYAEVPVVVQMRIKEQFLFGIGASYNSLISSKEEMNDASSDKVFDSGVYPFRRSSFDGILNASWLFYNNWVLNARYQYSLTPIRKIHDVPDGLGYKDQTNNQFTFRLVRMF
ncbi:MAG: porin family protein [Edaphocola sp.]